MMYEKYLVTGAKDPVGRLVVQMLLAEGCQVRVLVPPESDYSLLRGMGAEIAEGEIFDRDSLKEFLAVEDPRKSAVIHTEEILSISNDKNLNMRRINVAGAQNVIDMAMRAKIGRFVYLGSAYSLDPDSALSGEKVHFDRTKADGDYAASKAEASAYLMEKIAVNKFNASLLLPTFIIGPGFSEDYDMNKILKKYLEKKVSTVSGGHAFVDVRNVATALVAVCENGEPGGAYILNGEYKSSQDFFAEVSKQSGSEQVKEMPKWTQSKSMDKLVNTFYRVTKKDNPKEVYALFMNSPEANYESTVSGILPDSEVRKVHDSLVDVLSRPGNEVLPDRIPDLEKAAEAAAAKPETEKEAPKETSKVSEAVLKRAEESAARAKESGEDAEKRAAAAAAARERVQAKIEAARLKAEAAAAAAAGAKNEPAAEKPAASADDKEADIKEAPAEKKDDSFITKFSISDLMAEAEAKKATAVEDAKAEPEVKEPEAAAPEEAAPEVKESEVAEPEVKEPEIEAAAETVEEKVEEKVEETVEEAAPEKAEEIKNEADEAAADFAEFVDASVLEKKEEAAPVEETTPVVEAAEEKVEEKSEEAEPEEKTEKPDDSNKPLWERISAEDISEEEIFGEDNF